jgi:hypothetical protein
MDIALVRVAWLAFTGFLLWLYSNLAFLLLLFFLPLIRKNHGSKKIDSELEAINKKLDDIHLNGVGIIARLRDK